MTVPRDYDKETQEFEAILAYLKVHRGFEFYRL